MLGTPLAAALSEVLGIVEACGGGATVYAADTEIRAAVQVRGRADLAKLAEGGGGGGTSMAAAILDAVERRKHDLLVVLTDGETRWPSRDDLNGVQMLAVITREGLPAPEWMPQVRIDDDQ
jgi:predicted metal-dependent peptidase